MTEKKNGSQEPRRRLLKTVAGGSALGLTAIPGKWAKPMVASVVLPAHAQTSTASRCAFRLARCPPESLVSYSDGQYYDTPPFPTSGLPDGITYNGEYLSGSYNFSGSENDGTCPSPCDDLASTKYYSVQLNFDGEGGTYMAGRLEAHCGGDAVAEANFTFGGSHNEDESTDGGRVYSGIANKYFQACSYNGGSKYEESPNDIQSLGLERQGRPLQDFQFGHRIRRRLGIRAGR